MARTRKSRLPSQHAADAREAAQRRREEEARARKIPIGPGRPGQRFSYDDVEITTTLHDIYPVPKGTKGLAGASKAGQSFLRFMRREGGEVCGRGKLPAGSAALVRRGLVARSKAGYRGEWCLRLSRKMKRRKKGRA